MMACRSGCGYMLRVTVLVALFAPALPQPAATAAPVPQPADALPADARQRKDTLLPGQFWTTADELHSDDDPTLIAACEKAAREPDAGYGPRLKSIVRSGRSYEVRMAALRAVIANGYAGYVELVSDAVANPSDEMTGPVIRNMPRYLAYNFADRAAGLAVRPELVTSVVQAYADDPAVLFHAVTAELAASEHLGRREVEQLFRTLRILSERPGGVPRMTRREIGVLEDAPDYAHDDVRAIQSARGTPDSESWIARHAAVTWE